MTNYLFTNMANEQELILTYSEAHNLLKKYHPCPMMDLAHLKNGIINSICVPDGKITLQIYRNKIAHRRTYHHYSKN